MKLTRYTVTALSAVEGEPDGFSDTIEARSPLRAAQQFMASSPAAVQWSRPEPATPAQSARAVELAQRARVLVVGEHGRAQEYTLARTVVIEATGRRRPAARSRTRTRGAA
jgi:hypothetical protein